MSLFCAIICRWYVNLMILAAPSFSTSFRSSHQKHFVHLIFLGENKKIVLLELKLRIALTLQNISIHRDSQLRE